MRWKALVAQCVVAALVVSACASDGDAEQALEAPTTVSAEPTEVPTAATEEPTEVPTATAEEPTDVPTAATEEPTEVPEEESGDWTCAQQAPGDLVADPQVSSGLEELLQPGIPGLVAATVDSDGLLNIGAAGVRAIGSDDPINVTDRMHLGSDTKAMTATLLALLAEDGDIELSALVTDIWPRADAGWQGVTLLDLLHHRGGAEDNLPRDQSILWEQLWQSSIDAQHRPPTERAAEAQAVRSGFGQVLTGTPPSEPVGEFAYSNAGYILVGAAIEVRLGLPWEELMCERLFRPLAMRGCGFGPPPAPAPRGHRGAPDDLEATDPADPGSDNPSGLGPAGTVYCPVADWGRYLSWVLRGARGEDDMLPAETWELLLEPEGDYAAGWLVAQRPWANGAVYTHAGSNTMWFAVAWVAPGLDRAFITATNAATQPAQRATDQGIAMLLEMLS